MGVATAVPVSEYDILSVDVTKIGETKKLKKKPYSKPSFFEKFLDAFKEPLGLFFKKIANLFFNMRDKEVCVYVRLCVCI
jgi:hypothetical protein